MSTLEMILTILLGLLLVALFVLLVFVFTLFIGALKEYKAEWNSLFDDNADYDDRDEIM